MTTTYWSYPREKLDRLRARLGDGWPDGIKGVAYFVVSSVARDRALRGISAESLRGELSRCASQAEENGKDAPLSGANTRRVMRAFRIPDEGRHWFVNGDVATFDRELAKIEFAAPAPDALALAGSPLSLRPHRPHSVWNPEVLSDLAPVQGQPMGLVLELAGRPMRFGAARWLYGFSRISVVLEFKGSDTLRFEANPAVREGYKAEKFTLALRSVSTRPEFEFLSADGGPFDGLYVTDILGEVVGAAPGDRIEARTRVERRDGNVVFIGKDRPPSKARAEIITAIFAKRLSPEVDEPDTQFATLCEQTIFVEEKDSE